MKRILAAITLTLAAAAAFALPRPAQIEDALASQHYTDARSMINEVLRERPDSARAHLLNAYVLVHVDHNRSAANAELETAKGLDKRGDVKSSPLFGRVVAEIDLVAPAAPAKPAAQKPAHQQDNGNALRVLLIVCGLAAAGFALYLVIRVLSDGPRSTRVVYVGGGGYSSPSPLVASLPVGPVPGTGGNAVAVPQAVLAQQVVQQPAHQPMGAFGTAASVAGGVVAGNAISDMLRSRSGGRRDDDWSTSSSSPAPAPAPSPVSYDSDRSSYSSSSSGSSDWGGSSSSSSSSSDWGSSSSDSSSSFSSDSSSDW